MGAAVSAQWSVSVEYEEKENVFVLYRGALYSRHVTLCQSGMPGT